MNKLSMISAIGVFLGGFAVTSNYAIAQDEPSETVTVVAPFITHEVHKSMSVNSENNRGVYDVHSISSTVTYSDLDLTKQSDANTLLKRINDEAKADCAKIKAQFPDPPHAIVTTDSECARTAAQQSLTVANAIIANARLAMPSASSR